VNIRLTTVSPAPRPSFTPLSHSFTSSTSSISFPSNPLPSRRPHRSDRSASSPALPSIFSRLPRTPYVKRRLFARSTSFQGPPVTPELRIMDTRVTTFRINTCISVASKGLYLPLESTLMKKGGEGEGGLLTSRRSLFRLDVRRAATRFQCPTSLFSALRVSVANPTLARRADPPRFFVTSLPHYVVTSTTFQASLTALQARRSVNRRSPWTSLKRS
jgi:hypothetical protein